MMTNEERDAAYPLVDQVANACVKIMQALNGLEDARKERDRAVRRLHTEEGLPKRQVAAVIAERLEAGAWTAEQVGKVGVSPGSIRLILDRHD